MTGSLREAESVWRSDGVGLASEQLLRKSNDGAQNYGMGDVQTTLCCRFTTTLRASLSGTCPQTEDVVNQCSEFGSLREASRSEPTPRRRNVVWP